MDDLFKKTIEITDPEFRDALTREGALHAALEEIKGSGVILPGVVLCSALIEGMKAQIIQGRVMMAYKLASQSGVPIHLCSRIETHFENGRYFMTCHMEGGAEK